MLEIIMYSIKFADSHSLDSKGMESEFDSIMEFFATEAEHELCRQIHTDALGFWMEWV